MPRINHKNLMSAVCMSLIVSRAFGADEGKLKALFFFIPYTKSPHLTCDLSIHQES